MQKNKTPFQSDDIKDGSKHRKHAKLTRPQLGNFGRNEWAIIGTPCGNIQKIAYQLTAILSKDFKVSYVDADHKSADAETEEGKKESTALEAGANWVYTDKITHHRIDFNANLDSYTYRSLFNEQDVVLVNGNHFKAQKQIVVIDARKKSSLERKLDRLTDVDLILLEGEGEMVFPFLQKHLPNIGEIPVLKSRDITAIADFLLQKMKTNRPPLYGLVLAGGKSQRMGRDKGLIDYHGKAQREYTGDMLQSVCEKVFLSCRPEQAVQIQSEYQILSDVMLGLGPFGAIVSAFQHNPNAAWLVVACDLPLLDQNTLKYLTENRNPSKIATAFHNPATNFPEPLITVWEPKSYLTLLQFLVQGYSCPRKVLINSDIEVLEVLDTAKLKNVNRPEEYEEVKRLM
ncbi:MAG: NTP transferase domain-containing protein [Chitinophagales bacterium]